MSDFEHIDGIKGKDGWIPMSKILGMTNTDPARVKKGLWLMKRLGLLQCRKSGAELEYRISPAAIVFGLSWRNIKVDSDVVRTT